MFKYLRLPLQYFSADTGGDGGGDATPPATDSAPQDTPPADNGGAKDDSKTFTQDDVNNLIARESKTAQEKLLKKLGIEDFDTAKDGLEKFREWQESQKTEQEKQAETLKNLETEKGSLSSENETLKAQLSAMKAGVTTESIEDVVVLAKTLVNDDTDMDAAIAKVVEKYPQFASVQQEEESGDPKPKFSNGQHQKQDLTEAEKWAAAFK